MSKPKLLATHPFIGAATLALIVGFVSGPGVTADPPGWFFVCATLLLALAGLRLLVQGKVATSRAIGLLGLSSFACWAGLCSFGSIDPFLSKVSLAGWLGSIGLVAAIAMDLDSKESWALSAHALILVALGSCAYGLSLELSKGGMLISNFTNQDCFSVVPMVATLLALGLVDRAEGSERYYLIGIIPLLTLCVMLTSSRAGFMGLAAGLFLFGFSSRRRPGARMAMVAALAAPVLASLLLMSAGETEVLTDKWNQLLTRKEVGVQARLDVALYSLRAIRMRPFMGSGPGTFHLAYQEFRPPHEGEDYMNVAHDDYVQVAVETGLVGLALWLGSMVFGFHQGLRNGRDSGLFHYYGACAAVAAVAVYALVNFAVPVAVDLAFWLVPLGLALCYRPEPYLSRSLARLLGLLMLALGAVGVYLGAQVAWNNRSLVAAQQYQESLKWQDAITALSQNTDKSDIRIRLALATNYERLSAFNADPALKEKAIQELQAALSLSPHNLVVMLHLADLLEEQQDFAGALQLQERARRESPQTHTLDLVVARNYLLQGKFDEAAQALRVSGHEDVDSLGELLVVIEQLHKGSAPDRLQKWFGSSPELAVKVAHKAGDSALKIGNSTLAGQLYQWLLQQNPREPGVSYQLAQLETDPHVKLRLLEQELRLNGNEDVIPGALRMWTELKLQNGTARSAIPRLESFLTKQPRSLPIRLLLSETYTGAGMLADARRVLRDGLDYDRDGSLSFALGGLFEKEGDAEIALSYYEDAHRAHPENTAISAAIERLKSNPEALAPGFKSGSKTRKRLPIEALDEP